MDDNTFKAICVVGGYILLAVVFVSANDYGIEVSYDKGSHFQCKLQKIA